MPLVDRLRSAFSSEIGRRVTHGVTWSVGGAVLARGLNLLAFILVARIVGQRDFGALAVIQSTVAMFQIFAGLGMGLTATKYIAEFKSSHPEKVRRIIALSSSAALAAGLAFAVVVVLGAGWLAQVLAEPGLTALLRLSAAILFFEALCGVQLGILTGYERFKTIAQINVWSGLLGVPITVAGVIWFGVPGVVVSLLVASVLRAAFGHWAIRRGVPEGAAYLSPRQVGWIEELPVLYKFSLPVILSNALVTPVTWIANAMIVNEVNGYNEMGIFNAANQWRILIVYVPGFLGKVSLPVLADLFGRGDHDRFRRLLLSNILVTTGITLAPALVISLLSRPIMLAYGPEYVQSWFVVVLLALTGCLSALATMMGESIYAIGRGWINFALNLNWAVFFLGLIWWLKADGAMGLATATVLASVVHVLMSALVLRRHIHRRAVQQAS